MWRMMPAGIVSGRFQQLFRGRGNLLIPYARAWKAFIMTCICLGVLCIHHGPPQAAHALTLPCECISPDLAASLAGAHDGHLAEHQDRCPFQEQSLKAGPGIG